MTPPTIAPAGIVGRIADLAPGRRLVLTGIDRDGVRRLLACGAPSRSVLALPAESWPGADAVIARLLDDLADLALALWPRWHGGEDPPAAFPVSGPWLKAAMKCAAAGRPPRFRRTAPAFELRQLIGAVDPLGVILAAGIDPVAPARAAPVIAALEWALGHGAACVIACPVPPPPAPPYDRILYGALAVAPPPEPAGARFLARPSRAHPASATEQRIEAALRRDPELGPLFSANETVPLPGYGAPRVDLLWRAGRVVVELDGPEHRTDPTFGNDRHRDYELLVAGYRVLRITNEQVETDLQRAVEKIRAVVRVRRAEGGLCG
ncbi:endonuclease domain-containing protein [Methylobacterium sp. ID0610]|uniref:endonuclease domain-containing protein n=1 Tax=Methylobacterium carpenticola TaxID=3344827 RepID=UPI00368CDF47